MIRRRDTGPLRIVPPVAPAPPTATGVSSTDPDLAIAREAMRRAPEIRAERVATLRQRIAAGTYHVPDAVLARCLLTRET
jgi:anti-sigma28 factor (negative regulator of flagellin synthesis)